MPEGEIEFTPEGHVELPDVRVVSVVADSDEVWDCRADYDESVNPFEALGMLLVATFKQLVDFLPDMDEDDDED